ncbi:unnamed protein product [Allacma fusca]|uniref:Uncharacterized protein n=1 Tax=Allacma fusca TaxID=39272 RepID=A0A8J2NZR6_9HEXA|nr:unnamed protein product [Allacma fusca]
MELDILVGKCDSIMECDLKFSPMPPLVGFNDGLINEDVEIFRSYNKNNGVISAHGHGYVQCTSKFPNSDERNPSGYISKSDYMFIGLDNEIYFASKGFPNSSPSKFVSIGGNDEDAFVTDLPTDSEKFTKSWQLYLVFAKHVTKITYHAHKASSGRLISAEIDKNSEAETKNSGIESVVRDNSRLLKYIIIGCSVALVIFLAMVALYFVLWRKYQSSKELIRNLTEGEIYEFHNGIKTPERNKDGETPIESLAFNADMVIMSNALKFAETEVLVVDQIRERRCLAVIELCPHGDLNNFLKRYLGSYSNLTPEVLFQPVDMIEMGSRNDSDQKR